MKVIHVYNHFHPCVGGIERYIEDICVQLNKLGYQSDVCCLNRCRDSRETLKPFERYKGINIYRMPFLDAKYYKISPRVLNLMRKYDVIHIHGLGFFFDLLTSLKRAHKKPIVLSTHGGIFHTKNLSFLKKIYFGVWCRSKLKRVDAIIAVSKNDFELFSRVSKNVIYIPNGIDYRSYSRIKRRPIPRTLVFIGRVSKNKRIDRLIEVVYHLKKMGKGFRLFIAGPNWGEQKKLEALAKEKGVPREVNFLGKVSEKKKLELLSRAELFVSASEYEGFGISVLEAMASGVPVIVNDIEAFRNLVEDRKDGFLVDFSDPKRVAYLVLKLRKRDLRSVSRNAKRKAKTYDRKSLIKSIISLYKSLKS
ncbi:MAG: glycosyltransferase family 4 protein [Candidatus Aenigmarchaeota archaeon]|nr:glycosyltransferase family 4 protein [Candidatus Aenigmarchaeota archaeon]